MNILIAEDEAHLADGLRFNIEAEGHTAEIAADGGKALERLATGGVDAVVLDVMMPVKTGFEVVREMRARGDHTPVLMLTALGRPSDVVEGFDAGADDYLPKPFELNVFLARLSGMLRRLAWTREGGKPSPDAETREILGRTFDITNLELRHGTEVIRLTLMETKLLKYLIDNAGRAVSRREILESVWQLSEDTDTRAIDNFIVRLRRYLGDDGTTERTVETIRGVGYRINLP
jgi:DNA-binding response OmpR family regulator